jgi:hypothetical protein
MQILSRFCSASVVLLFLLVPGCGGSNNKLQSITVSPATLTAQGGQGQFTATGVFSNSPMTPMPVSVAWFAIPPAFDPPGQMLGFMRTSQPFTAQCLGFSPGVITVIALAPMDTSASANGSIPLSTFSDLVLTRNTTQEGGFVAATAQMTCP